MRYKELLAVTALMIFFSLSAMAHAQAGGAFQGQDNATQKVVAYFFYGEGCPHCAAEEPILDEFSAKYPQLDIIYYETWHNAENAQIFQNLSRACGSVVKGVPTLFIDQDVIVGFNEKTTPSQIEDKIIDCLDGHCIDPMQNMQCSEPVEIHPMTKSDSIIEVPVFGQIDTSRISLPLFTFIIGLLDGFNPCAMYVLMFLLTLLIYAKSRKKILIIGGVFIFASGAIYFLFMTAWLNFFLIVGYVDILRILIAIVAIVAGAINIKEFFFYKKGISLTIPEKYKPGLFSKMRKLVKEEQMASMIIGTVVLAVFSNLIELLCTAGFPAIYTRVLTLQDMGSVSYYSYLVLYNVVYVLPLAAIVGVFAVTMGRHKFTENQAKILKIIGGILMLTLGLILIFRPELLSF